LNYFVTAIGTDSGKTFTSAILCEALQADYWKPIQAGFPRDADAVKSLLSNSVSKIYNESYLLNTPASPHAAAKIDNVEISLDKIVLPQTNNNLIIEGAGGCLVPLNEKEFVIDIAKKFQTEIILVSNLYLGSINHTLLTVDYLKRNNFKVKGIIFNGQSNIESELVILKHSGYSCLLHIEQEKTADKEVVKKYTERLESNWNESL